MIWRKLGKIFDPTNYKLSNGCLEFAQSPQTIVFEDYVRIYYSTRKRTEDGKYISYIQFVDLNKTFTKVINMSTDTVIELGQLGCFDEHGIFPMNVLRHHDSIYAYTSGWTRRISVPADSGIGLAISNDGGVSFKKIGDGPVLTSSLYEPFLVADPFVKVIDNIFHMWYIYGTSWIANEKEMSSERIYKIGHATSTDGVNWEKEARQIISDKYADECQALPTVTKIHGVYYMFFCYRHAIDFRKNKDRAYRIGCAYSNDLRDWVRDDSKIPINVTEGSWDSDMLCYPHVFNCDEFTYMLYNGNEFGRYGFGLAKLEE